MCQIQLRSDLSLSPFSHPVFTCSLEFCCLEGSHLCGLFLWWIQSLACHVVFHFRISPLSLSSSAIQTNQTFRISEHVNYLFYKPGGGICKLLDLQIFQEYIFPDVKDRQFLIKFHKLAKKENLDVEKYNQLRVAISEAEHDLQRLRDPLQLHLPIKEIEKTVKKN